MAKNGKVISSATRTTKQPGNQFTKDKYNPVVLRQAGILAQHVRIDRRKGNPEVQGCDVDLTKAKFDRYQRGVVKGAKEQLDDNGVYDIVGSFRDDTLWTVDGYQRQLKMLSLQQTTCFAKVYFGLTYEEECILFLRINRDRKKVNTWREWFAATEAGVSPYVEIMAEILDHGLDTPIQNGFNSEDSDLVGTAVLIKAYEQQRLESFLQVLKGAWWFPKSGLTPLAKKGDFQKGLLKFLAKVNPADLNIERMITTLRGMGEDELYHRAIAEVQKRKCSRATDTGYRDALKMVGTEDNWLLAPLTA